MKSAEIRESFIHFFETKKHRRVNSAPVLPIGDKSLLFTNAGMNQFKGIFLDTEAPKELRVANSQKCIRVSGKHNDLEEVGRDGFHHTFFEMLGNWSFGDYYKKEAIEWSWELLTRVWNLDKSRLWVTVYEEDDEAFDLWKNNTDIFPERIIRSGAKDNFWEMAETGPCGPCSEIHYYVGNDPENQQAKMVNNSPDYWELWNLVFIQFNRKKDGSMEDLPKKHVDTGAGLERICSVMQNKDSNYKTDLFSKTIKDLERFSNSRYEDNEISYNVICDHIRMLSFAIADGVIPSNDGRGYVVRRVLRRGSKFAMNLEIKEPILFKLVDSVVSTMSSHYPELKVKQKYIEQTILSEEQSFLRTLENGVVQFEKIVKSTDENQIEGKDAFKLYDTYGFPLDLTQLMAEERNMTVDVKGFDNEMEKQKKLAKSGQKFEMDNIDLIWKLETDQSHSTFVGYDSKSISSKIINYSTNNDKLIIVLEKTPFYAESGGQIGDTGVIENDNFLAKVIDTQKNGDFILHFCKVEKGNIKNDLNVKCIIDEDRRKNIRINHTATHLLHQSVKDVLGEHVNQAGSLVHPEYLRFDITHPNKISVKELNEIETIVEKKIDEDIVIKTSVKSLNEAKKEGATALFGEKYGDKVRVVTIGKFSKELCGGTHVSSTGKINKFKIKHDKAISSGIRRIHAITDSYVDLFLKQKSNELDTLKDIEQKKEIEKETQSILLKSVNIDSIIENPLLEFDETKLFFAKVELGIASDLKTLNKKIRDKSASGIIFLYTEIDEKITISIGVSKDLITKSLNAGELVKSFAKELKGQGGGREDFAMAGIPFVHSDEVSILVKRITTEAMEKNNAISKTE